jgi:uncharacterized SAM-binding protein YcdF (DUF218 family)
VVSGAEPGAPAIDPRALDDLNRIAAYLARRDLTTLSRTDLPEPADVLVLCGSAVLCAIETAAAALRDGLAARILVSGGIGHSTEHLVRAVRDHPRYRDVPTASRPEAAVIADLLRRHHGVPESAIRTEEESTNCGENATLSVDLLMREPATARSVLLVQDPTMQRRTHASFRRALRDSPGVQLRSYAPFVPSVPGPDAREVRDPGGDVVWSIGRFTALVLGEIQRLSDDEHGYGPRGAGFIDHVDVPGDVLAAHQRLSRTRAGRSVG